MVFSLFISVFVWLCLNEAAPFMLWDTFPKQILTMQARISSQYNLTKTAQTNPGHPKGEVCAVLIYKTLHIISLVEDEQVYINILYENRPFDRHAQKGRLICFRFKKRRNYLQIYEYNCRK